MEPSPRSQSQGFSAKVEVVRYPTTEKMNEFSGILPPNGMGEIHLPSMPALS